MKRKKFLEFLKFKKRLNNFFHKLKFFNQNLYKTFLKYLKLNENKCKIEDKFKKYYDFNILKFPKNRLNKNVFKSEFFWTICDILNK